MTVKPAKNPVQFGNAKRGADTRAAGILDHPAGKMRLADTRVEGYPGSGFELILSVECEFASHGIVDFRDGSARGSLAGSLRWVVTNQAELLPILLREPKQASAQIIALVDPGKRSLAAFIFGSAVFGRRSRKILRNACVICGVVVEERRDGQNKAGIDRPDPRESNKRVFFKIRVFQNLALRVRVVRIKRNLIEVAA